MADTARASLVESASTARAAHQRSYEERMEVVYVTLLLLRDVLQGMQNAREVLLALCLVVVHSASNGAAIAAAVVCVAAAVLVSNIQRVFTFLELDPYDGAPVFSLCSSTADLALRSAWFTLHAEMLQPLQRLTDRTWSQLMADVATTRYV